MATRKEHEARAHDAFAREAKHRAKAKVAKEDPGFFDGYSKKSHEEWAEKAKSQGHDELAKAKRASK